VLPDCASAAPGDSPPIFVGSSQALVTAAEPFRATDALTLRRISARLPDSPGDSTAVDTTRSAKSPLQAFGWSFGPTVLAIGGPALLADDQLGTVAALTVALGGIVGPSLGHFYAENRSRAWWGIGIRATSSAVFVGAGVWALNEIDWLGDEDSAASVPGALAFIAFLTFTASGLLDIFNAPDSANEYNARHDLRAQVLPQYHPTTGSAGLTVRLRW